MNKGMRALGIFVFAGIFFLMLPLLASEDAQLQTLTEVDTSLNQQEKPIVTQDTSEQVQDTAQASVPSQQEGSADTQEVIPAESVAPSSVSSDAFSSSSDAQVVQASPDTSPTLSEQTRDAQAGTAPEQEGDSPDNESLLNMEGQGSVGGMGLPAIAATAGIAAAGLTGGAAAYQIYSQYQDNKRKASEQKEKTATLQDPRKGAETPTPTPIEEKKDGPKSPAPEKEEKEGKGTTTSGTDSNTKPATSTTPPSDEDALYTKVKDAEKNQQEAQQAIRQAPPEVAAKVQQKIAEERAQEMKDLTKKQADLQANYDKETDPAKKSELGAQIKKVNDEAASKKSLIAQDDLFRKDLTKELKDKEKAADERVKSLNDEKKKIEADSSLDPEEKKKQIDSKQQEIDTATKEKDDTKKRSDAMKKADEAIKKAQAAPAPSPSATAPSTTPSPSDNKANSSATPDSSPKSTPPPSASPLQDPRKADEPEK